MLELICVVRIPLNSSMFRTYHAVCVDGGMRSSTNEGYYTRCIYYLIWMCFYIHYSFYNMAPTQQILSFKDTLGQSPDIRFRMAVQLLHMDATVYTLQVVDRANISFTVQLEGNAAQIQEVIKEMQLNLEFVEQVQQLKSRGKSQGMYNLKICE